MKPSEAVIAAVSGVLVEGEEIVAQLPGKEAKLPPTPTKWLWRLVMPEKWYFVTGLIGAAITGLGTPAIGYLMSEFLVVFFHDDVAYMRRQALKWSMVFISFGAIQSVGAVLRQYSFALITERMVRRVRISAFANIVRQHIGWFDG